MASTTQYNLSQLTPNNLGIKSLAELIYLKVLKYGNLSEIATISYGILNDQIVGGIGRLESVGTSQQNCNITYNASKADFVEQVWKLANVTIAEKLCADDFEKTIARFTMKTGTNRADLTQTELFEYIVIPLITDAVEECIWRISFFGDSAAKNVSDGGVVTDGINTNLFTITDGFFKKIDDLVASDSSRRTTIDANGATTKLAQVKNLKESGVAMSVFDRLIDDAPLELQFNDQAFILSTASLVSALNSDIKGNNKGSELQYKSIFEDSNLRETTYSGVRIITCPTLDKMIMKYEDQGLTFRNRHRAIFCTKDFLNVGFESTSSLKDFDIFYDRKDKLNYINAQDKIGTMLWDKLFQIAY